MLRTLPAAVLALLLLPWRLEAASPRAKPPEKPWVVILGSKPRPAEAQALLDSMREKRPLQWLKPAEGFPKLLESASLPGLAPGLNVLVLGVCGTRETALAARARVLPMVADAYVKQLTGPAPLACPTSTPLEARLPKGAVRLASVPFKQDKALVLSVYKVNERSVMECKTNDLLIRLEYGREVLAQESLGGDCRGVCTPEAKREGEERMAEIARRIENDEGSTSELDYNLQGLMQRPRQSDEAAVGEDEVTRVGSVAARHQPPVLHLEVADDVLRWHMPGAGCTGQGEARASRGGA